jgi:palmitoyltransferase
VIAPNLRWPLLTVPLCILAATNLIAHYYFVCTVRPGFADDVSARPAEGMLWAAPLEQSPSRSSGVHWTENVRVTKAHMTRCKRCGVIRPEVSKLSHQMTAKLRRWRGRTIVGYATAACSSTTIIVQCAVLLNPYFTWTQPSTTVQVHISACEISQNLIVLVGVNQCVGLHNERHFVLFMCVLCPSLLPLPCLAFLMT